MGKVQSFGILNKGSGFTRQATSARLAVDIIQVWINSSPSNCCISHFKAQLAQLFFIRHLKMYVLDKRNTLWLCDTVRQTSFGKSAAVADRRSSLAVDFLRDVCLAVLRNHKVFLLYAKVNGPGQAQLDENKYKDPRSTMPHQYYKYT